MHQDNGVCSMQAEEMREEHLLFLKMDRRIVCGVEKCKPLPHRHLQQEVILAEAEAQVSA